MADHEQRLGLPILAFADRFAFERWLAAEPRRSPGIWVKLRKTGAPVTGLSKADAIDAALCHGWIDGQQHPYDESYWFTRFTARRPASRWSQVNRQRAGELIAAERMRPAGLAEIQAAQADGRWDAAYAPASTAEPCAEFQAALDASPEAAAAFHALRCSDRYAILHRINNLKTAKGRAKAISDTVARLR